MGIKHDTERVRVLMQEGRTRWEAMDRILATYRNKGNT